MLKNPDTKQRVKVRPSTDHEYSNKEGVYHYQDGDCSHPCVVTFGDGKPTYFKAEELDSI